VKVALAQINPTIGDVEGNTAKILSGIGRAERERADLVVFPELSVLGYPPRDLLRYADVVQRNAAAVEEIARHCTEITAVVGCARPDPMGRGKGVFNAAAICRGGRITEWYAKTLLPTYDVFDDLRHFDPGSEGLIFTLSAGGKGVRAAVSICEDLWNNRQFDGRPVYARDPISDSARNGADVFINLSGSPFRAGIQQDREQLFANEVREFDKPLVYVNQVAANDDLIFDGCSMILGADGRVLARAKSFEEDLLIYDFASPRAARIEPLPERAACLRSALVLGIRDYVRKCGFSDVLLGLSGGVDSAVTAALAVDALGAAHVHGVALPSRFTSRASGDDARVLAQNLGISLTTLSIEEIHRAFEDAVEPHFQDGGAGVVFENIQSRIRGNLLMSFANRRGWLLLTTGNKSELATGYCTLYGDMSGAFAVLCDVLKSNVYELAREINRSAGQSAIPERTIERAPTAELRDGQTDQDTLPPYGVLDPILEQFIEFEKSPEDIAAMGFDLSTVDRIVRMVLSSEHKRKQLPIGPKVTRRAFGSGRRMPIAAKYR